MTEFSPYKEIKFQISDRTRIYEILAVIFTAIGKFIFMDYLEWRFPFILIVILGWTLYIFLRKREIKQIFKYWGLTKSSFKQASIKVLPFGLISIVTCYLIGYFQGTINLTWRIFPILILYPIWGTIQQLLTMALVAGNLNDLKSKKMNKLVIVLITATLFSIMHFPNYWLVLGTFALALFYGYIYLKVRNVFVLGILHGWLGAFFFYNVLNRDPFIEVFGSF
jgi:uncharacterized protein